MAPLVGRIDGRGRVPDVFAGTDRFRPLECIGRGSMGTVYRAHDAELDLVVALKSLRQLDGEELYRLKTEFRLLAGIVHRNLVQLYDLVVDGQGGFFTMEFVPGADFVRHVRRPAAPDGAAARLDRLLAAAPQLVHGLAAVHAAHRVHRDVKPANVLVAPDGRVVILDFGLAAPHGDASWKDSSGRLAGTIAYMAPEQAWGGEVGPPADLYALGVVLFEALTGRLPLDGDPAQLLQVKATGRPPDARAVEPAAPAWLAELLAGLLDPVPARRPAIDAVLAALADATQPPARRAAAAPARQALVGRAREAAALAALLDGGRDGAALVRVGGPSGIGKTALVQHVLAGRARADEVLVLSGRCLEQELVPLKAFDAIVDQASRFLLSVGDSAAAYLPRNADALLRLFPVLGRVPAVAAAPKLARGGRDSREERRLAFAALRELLARLGDARTLLLWIDDAQWADLDSAALLTALLRPPDPPRLALVVSDRADGALPLLAGLDDLAGQPGAPRIGALRLGPLAPEDAAALVAQRAGRDVDPGTAATLVREAGGSPFLLVELARGHRALHGDRPLDLASLLRARLAELPAPARALVELAAVGGAPVERSALLRAARLGEAGRPLVAMLEHEGLVRTLATGEYLAVEPYHDRIRDRVLADLSPTRRQARHLEIAVALEGSEAAAPDQLAVHFHGGGRLAHAAVYAERAAARAAGQLAFARAAASYRQAREWDPRDAARARRLQELEGEALANAGQFADAGQACLAAARAAPGLEGLALRRRACEHLLAAGNEADGLVELAALLRDLGLPYPASAAHAVAGVAARLLLLRLRPLSMWRPAARVSEADALRIDTLYAAAKSLVDSDAARGVYMAVLALRRALRAGDAERLGRSACIFGGALIAGGGPLFAGFGRRLLALAERLADETDSPGLRGQVLVGTGQVFMLEGRWPDALARSRAGVELLATHGGYVFEQHIGQVDMLRSLTELGDLRGLEAAAAQLADAAVTTRNARSEIYALSPLARLQLARGDLAGARALVRRATDLLPRAAFHLNHLYVLRTQLVCDLYAGAATEGLTRLEAAWPAVRAAHLLRISLSRVDAWTMRARLALASAAQTPEPARRAALLAGAARDARRLLRERRPDATPHGHQIAAGVAALRGAQAAAEAAYETAVRGYDAAGMAMDAACTRIRLGELRGAAGVRLRADAEAWLRAAGVGAPQRWAAIYAPSVGA